MAEGGGIPALVAKSGQLTRIPLETHQRFTDMLYRVSESRSSGWYKSEGRLTNFIF